MTVGITELPPEGMQLGGVALAGDAERGTRTTEGLSLLFTAAGITVQGPQPQIERLLVWSGLDSASCREKIVLPDGRNAAVMELTSGGQSIRFLFPTENVTPGQAAYLDQALPHWLARYKGTPTAPIPSPSNGFGPTSTQVPPPGGTPPAPHPESGAPPPPAPPPPPPPLAQEPTTSPLPAPPSAVGDPVAAAAAGDTLARAGSSPVQGSPGVGAVPPGSPALVMPPSAGSPGFLPGPPGSPPPPPPGPGPQGAGGWEAAIDPLPSGTAWDNPPLGQPMSAPLDTPDPPAKKKRGRRKAQAPVAVTQLPQEPPVDLLPPPPASGTADSGGGAAVWKPPVDAATGQVLWDSPAGSSDPIAPEVYAPQRGRRKRGANKAAVAGAAAAGAAAGTGVGVAPPTTAPPTAAPRTAVPPTAAPPPGGLPGPTVSSSPFFSPEVLAVPADESTMAKPTAKKSRTTLVLLLVLLLVVVGGIAFVVVKKRNSTTATTLAPAVSPTSPVPSPTVAANALASTINLRLGDLPAGWAPRAAVGQVARPPVAPVAAQVRATTAMAHCLGVSSVTTAGLFGTAALPGQTGAALSPTFQSAANPTIQMYSSTRVMTTPAEAQALAAPFANPSFVACFGAFQSALVAAAVPGATASVQPVSLAVPAGVTTFAYLTTLTIPNQGTEIVGQAFMIGGRVESKLEPTTGGPPVPTDAFTPAYNAITGRIALAVGR
jgi:hypothetical protein